MLKNESTGPVGADTVKHAQFRLSGETFMVMDSGHDHGFGFNEAVSLMITCKDQAEIDRYWEMSTVPEAEQCGWLKDRFGVSWQVVPEAMDAMMTHPDRARVDRVTDAFLAMKKFDVAALERAFAA
jgi:predicted 3-demethylubiquinone-9 3-methyltransferase (glyoxalase superfamily)